MFSETAALIVFSLFVVAVAFVFAVLPALANHAHKRRRRRGY